MKNRFFKKKVSNFINFSEDYIEYLYHILKNLNKKNIKEFENLLEVARKKKTNNFYCWEWWSCSDLNNNGK